MKGCRKTCVPGSIPGGTRHKKEYAKILSSGGVMNWMNDYPIDHPNFGSIGFSCRQELFIEFSYI